MSECVVRMELPKNCYECEMRRAVAFCPIGRWPVAGYKKQRHDDCPIICQLPEGHGRLIDADAIEYVISENGCQDDFAYRYDINELPTIVPAESET